MPKKFDPEFISDTKAENSKESKKFKSETVNDEPAASLNPEQINEPIHAATDAENKTTSSQIPPIPEPEKDLFKERFDEYFKGIDGLVGGQIAVGLVDDLKASFLFMYAKKQGIEIEKSALLMDEKTKNFAAFLVDHAIKNNFFDIIKKYPILAALGVILISGGSTFLMLQMLKGMKSESQKKDDEISKLKKDLEDLKRNAGRENVSDVIDENKVAEIISMEKIERNPALHDYLNQS
jgi:hypothetical protein